MAGDPLTLDLLPTAEAVLTLGAVVVRELKERGVVTLFVDHSTGTVQFCPAGEIELDSLSEEDALARLLERGYNDESLLAYLKGRAARRSTTEGRHGSHL